MTGPGFTVFDHDPRIARWAEAALEVARRLDLMPRRHGGTWFVGVDALPNDPDGTIAGVPLAGPWSVAGPWHQAQLSVVFPGYPGRDPDESESAHRFRCDRDAAHVDGLLPEGPSRRRHLREPHKFILGIPLNDIAQSPLVVWEGSHELMGQAFEKAFRGLPPREWGDVDVTEIYQSARRAAFDQCSRKTIHMRPGQAVLLHRHLLHGVAPWDGAAAEEGRMVAYFRPQGRFEDWI